MIKGILTSIVFLFFALTCAGQIHFYHLVDQAKIQEKYGFILHSVEQSTESSTSSFPTTVIKDVNLCVRRKGVVSMYPGEIRVDIWKISDSTNCGENGIYRSSSIRILRFDEDRKTFGESTRVMWIPFRAISVGVNSLPFRIRGSSYQNRNNVKTRVPTNVSSSFSLAVDVGYTIGWSQFSTRNMVNWSITAGPYVGPSIVQLTKDSVENPDLWTNNQSNAALDYGFNLIFSRNNLGLVVAFGFERALGTNGDQWIYNKVPYIGFGINNSSLR